VSIKLVRAFFSVRCGGGGVVGTIWLLRKTIDLYTRPGGVYCTVKTGSE